jgi:DNA-binding transcriptional LysR family regulator
LGISLLSRAAVEVELAGGQLGEIALRDLPPSRPWYVLRSSVGPARPVVQELLAHLRLG